jgi:DNA-binding CsgD family transcriptional regulator
MPTLTGLPWPKIHDFLVEVGSEQTVQAFTQTLMKKIYSLIPHDLGASLCELGKMNPLYCRDGINISKKWMNTYNNYYRRIAPKLIDFDDKWFTSDFHPFQNTEYVSDFIFAQGIRHASGLILNDRRNNSSILIALFDSKYNFERSDDIKSILEVIQSHLTNYYTHLNLISNLDNTNIHASELAADCKLLSKREAEIAALLCKRLHASEIGSLLLISTQTVYRHIANIYEKLKVRNRRQLLLKLLGKQKEL